ncbi:NAD-dependent epimerase/dehydratase family protein [Psychrobacter glaciei]|uniref:NAD-dependent epimerase/dehydratase family protein n=1 Tax=Psychrobacter glaciei TaxID=619771 RepID=UPI003F45E628
MKRILITGGAGFIGTNLVSHLLKKDPDLKITILDNFFTGDYNRISKFDVNVVEGEVEDKNLVRSLVSNSDEVYHLACRNVIVSSSNPMKDLETNTIGTLNILESCEEYNVNKLLYSSTSSIYGNALSLPVNEDARKEFLNFYSVSKFAGEAYAQCMAITKKLPVVVVRYSNVYGYYQNNLNPYCGAIGKFIDWAIENRDLTIFGDGQQTRDFTFIDDACTATVKAMEYCQPGRFEIFNVGTGVETSINDIARIVINGTGSNSSLTNVEPRDIDNVRRRVLNIDRTRTLLDWNPMSSIDKGIKETISWYRNQTEAGDFYE